MKSWRCHKTKNDAQLAGSLQVIRTQQAQFPAGIRTPMVKPSLKPKKAEKGGTPKLASCAARHAPMQLRFYFWFMAAEQEGSRHYQRSMAAGSVLL